MKRLHVAVASFASGVLARFLVVFVAITVGSVVVPTRLGAQPVSVSPIDAPVSAWSDPNAWNPPGVPNNTAAVQYSVNWNLGAGLVAVDGDYTVSNFQWFSAGTLRQASAPDGTPGRLTVGGVIQWRQGVLDNVPLVSGGLLLLQGTGERRMNGGSLTVQGKGQLIDLNLDMVGGATLVVNGSFELFSETAINGTAPGFTGGGRIQNFGTFGRFNIGEIARIGPGILFENFGSFLVAAGELDVASFSQSLGSFSLGPSAIVASPNPVRLDGGLWSGAGFVNATVLADCAIEPGGVGKIGNLNASSARLGDDAVLSIELAGDQGNDLLEVFGPLQLGGTLRIRMRPGLAPSFPPDAQVVIGGGVQVTGAFRNVAPGGRLFTEGNEGSFRVDYNGSNQTDPSHVWLGDFRRNPEGGVRRLKLPYLLVYGRPPDGPQPEGTVWLAMADGTLDVKLTDGSSPRLSPDRNLLAFLRGSPGTPFPNLWVKDLSKGAENVLQFIDAANGPISDLAFLSDGSGIDTAADCRIATVDLSGPGAVLYQGNPCSFTDLALNPVDGEFIASVAGKGIFRADPLAIQIDATFAGDRHPAWAPDGKSFVVVNGSDLAVVPQAGGARRSLLAASGLRVSGVGAPAWSPDGAWVFVPMTVEGEPGIYAVAPDGSGSLGRIAADLSGVPASMIGAVVAVDPFPDVHWELDLLPPTVQTGIANVLDLPSNTLVGWLGGITVDAIYYYFDTAQGGFVAVENAFGSGWDSNPAVPTGSGGTWQSFDLSAAPFPVVGKLAHPARMNQLPKGPAFFGMRAPQTADFATMFGFAPPKGSQLERFVNGAQQILLFDGFHWTAGTNVPPQIIPEPVAEITEAWLVLFGGPGIYDQPDDQRATLGTPAAFHVNAVGVPPLKYRWHRASDTAGDLGNGSDTLSFAAIRAEDLGEYVVEITDAHGTTTSRNARLAADAPLGVVSLASDQGNPVALGSDVTLSVVATGNGTLSYQWFRNGKAIPGESSDHLLLVAIGPKSGGMYSVRVGDGTGSLFGGPIPLIPDVPPGPFSDEFFAVGPGFPGLTNEIVGVSGSVRGSNATATHETGEPDHAGAPARNSVWVSWNPTVSGIATFDTSGSGFDTRLAVYQQITVNTPQVSEIDPVVANDEAEPGVHTSRVRFEVHAGVHYFVAVDGAALGHGVIVLSWELEETPLKLPRLLSQTAVVNYQPGDPVTLGVAALATPPAQLAITWFRNGVPIPGATSPNLDLGVANPAVVGIYETEIRQVYPDGSSEVIRSLPTDLQLSQRSDGADLGLRAKDRAVDAIAQAGAGGGRAASPAGTGRPGGLSRGVSGMQSFGTTGASLDDGEPALCGVAGHASMNYPIPCAVDGIVTVNTSGSNFDTVLGVYYDSGESDDFFESLRLVACNDNVSVADATSAVTFCARAGFTYLVFVDGANGASGTVQLHYTMSLVDPKTGCPGPSVVCPARPARRVATAGTAVTLSMTAGGTQPMTLAWYHDGTLVQTGASTSLVLSNVGPASAGAYSVRVSNDDGMSESVVAHVAVVTDDQPLLGYVPECDGSITFEIAGAKNTAYAFEGSSDLSAWTTLFTGSSTNGVMRLPVLNVTETLGKTYRARKP